MKLELERSSLARAKEGMSPYYGTWDLFARAELHKAYLGQQTLQAVLRSLAAKWNSLRS